MKTVLVRKKKAIMGTKIKPTEGQIVSKRIPQQSRASALKTKPRLESSTPTDLVRDASFSPRSLRSQPSVAELADLSPRRDVLLDLDTSTESIGGASLAGAVAISPTKPLMPGTRVADLADVCESVFAPVAVGQLKMAPGDPSPFKRTKPDSLVCDVDKGGLVHQWNSPKRRKTSASSDADSDNVPLIAVKEAEKSVKHEEIRENQSVKCCVTGCLTPPSTSDDHFFHPFPENPNIRARWIEWILDSNGDSFQLSGVERICSVHFPKNAFGASGILLSAARPSVLRDRVVTKAKVSSEKAKDAQNIGRLRGSRPPALIKTDQEQKSDSKACHRKTRSFEVEEKKNPRLVAKSRSSDVGKTAKLNKLCNSCTGECTFQEKFMCSYCSPNVGIGTFDEKFELHQHYVKFHKISKPVRGRKRNAVFGRKKVISAADFQNSFIKFLDNQLRIMQGKTGQRGFIVVRPPDYLVRKFGPRIFIGKDADTQRVREEWDRRCSLKAEEEISE